MTFNELQKEKLVAMKASDKERIKVLNDIIVLVQKEQTKGKVKIEATDEMVTQCAIKVQKTLEEMVATCPGKTKDKDYTPLLESYKHQLTIAREYAPQLISDPARIRVIVEELLANAELLPCKQNKGKIMKTVMPQLKGQVDMSVANQVLNSMIS